MYQLARGQHIGPYRVRAPKRVLYVDAEMSDLSVQERYMSLEAVYGTDTADNYMTFGVNCMPDGVRVHMDIRDRDCQKKIMQMARDVRAEAIVIDNVRAAADGFPENDAHEWKKLDDWWQELRSQEKLTVIWVHHDNKDKESPTFAGSEAAIRGSEVVVGVRSGGTERIDALAQKVMDATRDKEGAARFTVHHAIKVRYTKHRFRDNAIHRDHEVMYVKRLEDGNVQLQKVSDDDKLTVNQQKAQSLSEAERVWAYRKGFVETHPLSIKATASEMGIGHRRVAPLFQEIEGDLAAQARIRRLFQDDAAQYEF
jgi:RecA-family ATPase